MYERILVPTDGSAFATLAAERAFELAAALDADVHVVSVIESGPLGWLRLPGDSGSAADVFSERADEAVARLARRGADRDLNVTTAVERGIAVRELLSYVEESEIDLVVMGSRGRGGLDGMLLGSVTEGVTRHGDVDVLVVDDDGDVTDHE